MKKLSLIFSILFIALCSFQVATTKKVTGTHDGDSIKFWGETKYVRLMGVDAPEVFSPFVTKTQPMGKEAGDWLRAFIKNKEVFVSEYKKRDMYGRKLVVVIYNGTDLAETIIANGYAHYEYSNTLKKEQRNRYKAAEQTAKMERLGIWGQTDSLGRYLTPIRPSVWRKQHKGK